MKKFMFALFAALMLGGASAQLTASTAQDGGNQVDGSRALWAG